MGCKILCSSNSYEEAAAMFDGIEAMRAESKSIERVTHGNIRGIFFGNRAHKSKGKFSWHNKGNIRKMSAKTGAQDSRNIALGAVDEVWELKDNSTPSFVKKALSSQDEPIYGEITTEGTVEDGYLDDRLKEARKVLKEELNRPYWMIWLFTQDNETEIWQNEQSWNKSNPSLGIIKKWRYLRDRIEEAKTNSAERILTLCKDFNIKQGAATAWLQDAEIINIATFRIEDFTGCFYIGGNDFMETTDLCASKLLLMKPGEKTIYFYSHYWIPEAKLILSPDDVDYRQWERDGYLTIVEGNSVDSSVVADWQIELMREYDLKPFKSGYDNRFAKDYINRFEEYFGKDIAVNVPQDAKCLNNPMRRLEADLRDKLVNYNNCYGDFWCFKNTGIKLDTIGRIQPCKLKTTGRIDGTAAALCCYAVFEWNKAKFLQLING
jgi:phage terminase large subunit-like protein